MAMPQFWSAVPQVEEPANEILFEPPQKVFQSKQFLFHLFVHEQAHEATLPNPLHVLAGQAPP